MRDKVTKEEEKEEGKTEGNNKHFVDRGNQSICH
jgi:hypothetical protein